jgi:hypothetical protein
MSRLSIPADVDELIKQVSPFISSNTNAVDTIRTALFRMKEHYILNQQTKISLDNPLHPYFSRATPEEEAAVLEHRANPQLSKAKTSKEMINWLND